MYVGEFKPAASPVERLRLGFDFATELADGETLISADWSIVQAANSTIADALASSRLSTDPAVIDAQTLKKTTQIFEVGGVDGCTYMVHCQVETSDGQVLEMSGLLACVKPK